MAFAVVACSRCQEPWLVELRHRTSRCPKCQGSADLRRRRRLWSGDNVREAQAAVGRLRAAMAQGIDADEAEEAIAPAEPLVRHDSPIGAAAAQARKVRNPSRRADEVAAWLTRLQGDTAHDAYVEALGMAGLDTSRAEREIIRMLATDIIYEPRAGAYRALDA